MLRPPIRVARPADWTGRLAYLAVWVNLLIVTVVAMLVRLPRAWTDPLPHPLVLRLGLVLFAMIVLKGVATVVYTRLPGAAFLSGKTITFRERGRRHRVQVRDVAAVVVDLRPSPVHEMFVLRMHEGGEHDLCPVRWPGAGRLYASIVRRVAPRVRATPKHEQ